MRREEAMLFGGDGSMLLKISHILYYLYNPYPPNSLIKHYI